MNLLHLDLFPFYAALLAIAVWLSAPNIRAVRLALNILFVFAAVKIIALLWLRDLGILWYVICALAQLYILMNAEGIQLEFRLMRALAALGMGAQCWALLTHGHHSHVLYWSVINLLQLAEVAVLMAASPTVLLIVGRWLVTHRYPVPPWLQRSVLEGVRYVGR